MRLDDIYEVAALGTTCLGVAALAAGVSGEVVSPIVLVGALVVGIADIYWLLGGRGAY